MSKEIKEYDENNNEIYYKDNRGYELCFKYVNNEQVEITKEEFEQIKRDKEYLEFISREPINPFSLLDI